MTPAEHTTSLLQIILAFTVIIGLLGLFYFGLRFVVSRGLKIPNIPGMPQRARRLEIVESLPLDVRRRLVIVRCDGKEHLLLLGANQDIVIANELPTT